MADLEMWFHLLEQGFFSYIAEPLCAFRAHGRQQSERDRATMRSAIENRDLLKGYLDRPYVRLRRWMRRYLEFDATRRIVRRARKLGAGTDAAEAAVRDYGGWAKYRERAFRNAVREQFLKTQRLFRRHVQPRVQRTLAALPVPGRAPGINVAGFAKGEYGIGESSRAMWRAVKRTGLPFALINVHSRMHSNRDETFTEFAAENPYRVNLMTFSFDYSRRFCRDVGRRFFEGR
jgi:hypothetical protein